jgi:hypothetical protein
MNLNKEEHRGRLFKAMVSSYRKLEPFRRMNQALVEEYAGSGYGQESERPKYETYLNLMGQAVDAYTMSLVANRPRVTVETPHAKLKFFASQYSVAINNMLQEIGIEDVLRKWVKSAFFSFGILKVHLADVGELELWGKRVDPGTPFVSNVSLDDWVHDMTATRWDQIMYAADAYRVPFDTLGDPIFNPEVVKDLAPSNRSVTGDAQMRAEMLSKGYQTDQDDVEPMIDLMDVWVPRHGRVYTFAMDANQMFQGKGGILTDFQWDGPELGPYHTLAFNEIPDNIMPASPASHLRSLCSLCNNLIRKQAKQARRQKDIHTYTPSGVDDAARIQRADDGQWVCVGDPKEIGLVKMGGVDASNQAFLSHSIELVDRMAGNLPALLGLGPQADTLGQEQMIAGSASKKEASMKIICLEATTKVVRNLGWLLWNDSTKIMPGRMPIPGVDGMSVDATWTPERRMGQFFDYDLGIDVHSMPYQSPEQKVKTITGLLTQVYAPMGQVLMQQGGQINLQALTDMFSELLYLPRLKDIVQFSAPDAGQPPELGAGSPPASSPSMPSSTSREYVRRSVSTGGTPENRNRDQQQAWLAAARGGQQQGPQMAQTG